MSQSSLLNRFLSKGSLQVKSDSNVAVDSQELLLRRFRWRIALSFMGLSSLVYLTLTVLGIIFFADRMTDNLDNQLKVMSSEVGHAIVAEDGMPKFKDWERRVQTDLKHSLVTIMLYDLSGRLVDRYGIKGVERLSLNQSEIQEGGFSERVRTSPIMKDEHIVGYLELEIGTAARDSAIIQLVAMTALVAPLVLLGLGISSFLIARRASQPLEENLNMLRRFSSDASHELKTPLSAIRMRTELLESKLKNLDLPLKDVVVIKEAAEHMSKTVESLLLLARLSEVETYEALAPVSLTELLEVLFEEFQNAFAEKGLYLKKEVAEGISVPGRANSLERLLRNLIENALKYTDKGGLTLRLSADSSYAKISVSDTGIGIGEESLPHIFERFYRVDQARSRKSGGVGLGLAIVKAVAESHRGTVEAQSSPESGSTFTVLLPLRSNG
jgi:signal transduction histidine kinase